MKRKIIQIDEDKCNGCGKCTTVCAEAALEIVDGKAKVVGDFLCDGMGACLDVCSVGALKIVEKEVEDYDPQRTYQHVKEVRGEEAAQKVHGIEAVKKESEVVAESMKCGCPGTMMRDFTDDKADDIEDKSVKLSSQLRQWPIQSMLVMPTAPYFDNADLLIAADCVPFACADFHQNYLKGRALVIGCPKLDDIETFKDKLKDILANNEVKSITVTHMEVPCCFGLYHMVEEVIEEIGKDIPLNKHIISLQGK